MVVVAKNENEDMDEGVYKFRPDVTYETEDLDKIELTYATKREDKKVPNPLNVILSEAEQVSCLVVRTLCGVYALWCVRLQCWACSS